MRRFLVGVIGIVAVTLSDPRVHGALDTLVSLGGLVPTGPAVDPPSWWTYDGTSATRADVSDIPAAVNDAPALGAFAGYAPSCLVFEEGLSQFQRVLFLVGNGDSVRGRSRTRLAGLLVSFGLLKSF